MKNLLSTAINLSGYHKTVVLPVNAYGVPNQKPWPKSRYIHPLHPHYQVFRYTCPKLPTVELYMITLVEIHVGNQI